MLYKSAFVDLCLWMSNQKGVGVKASFLHMELVRAIHVHVQVHVHVHVHLHVLDDFPY